LVACNIENPIDARITRPSGPNQSEVNSVGRLRRSPSFAATAAVAAGSQPRASRESRLAVRLLTIFGFLSPARPRIF